MKKKILIISVYKKLMKNLFEIMLRCTKDYRENILKIVSIKAFHFELLTNIFRTLLIICQINS